MKTDITIESETPEDVELIDLLADARNYGLDQAGLSPEELAVVFNQFAIGLLKEKEDFGGPSYDCPNCGESMMDVKADALGVDPVAQPCGCTLSYEDLPQELFLDS